MMPRYGMNVGWFSCHSVHVLFQSYLEKILFFDLKVATCFFPETSTFLHFVSQRLCILFIKYLALSLSMQMFKVIKTCCDAEIIEAPRIDMGKPIVVPMVPGTKSPSHQSQNTNPNYHNTDKQSQGKGHHGNINDHNQVLDSDKDHGKVTQGHTRSHNVTQGHARPRKATQGHTRYLSKEGSLCVETQTLACWTTFWELVYTFLIVLLLLLSLLILLLLLLIIYCKLICMH